MCAISGIIPQNTATDYEESIMKMTRMVAHRGPDWEQFGKYGKLWLGHRRLSILDLSEAAIQPFQANKVTVVFNGEIYNFRELRRELSWYDYKTSGDTEVLIPAWIQWGYDMACHLRGMWAFAIYDEEQQTVFCSRDRFGIKPFYYYPQKERFSFGSEIKQFTVLPGWKAVANPDRIRDFLIYELSDHTNETMFQGVYQLRPGENLIYEINNHSYKTIKYYDIRNESIDKAGKDVALCLRKALCDSVEEHCLSDVRLGASLSGGLDSSTIVANMVRSEIDGQTCKPCCTISSCSHDKRFDEQEYIDCVTANLGLDNCKIFPDISLLWQELDRLTYHQDEPFGSTSIFAQWCVFQTAKELDLPVMLDGQGADEILGGYPGFTTVYLAELLRKGRAVRWLKEIKNAKRLYGESGGRLAYLSARKLAPRWMVSLFRRKSWKSGAGSWLRKDDKYRKKTLQMIASMEPADVKEYSLQQITCSGLPRLLHYADRDSMAHSVETRVPFLDHRVVEICVGAPVEAKFRGGVRKTLLRDAERGILPEKIEKRIGKLGFVTPETVWIRQNAHRFRELFEQGIRVLSPILDTERAMEWFDAAISGESQLDYTIWRVVSLGVWFRIFSVEWES